MLGDRTKALDYLDRFLIGKNDKELLFAAALVYNQLRETGPAFRVVKQGSGCGVLKVGGQRNPGFR